MFVEAERVVLDLITLPLPEPVVQEPVVEEPAVEEPVVKERRPPLPPAPAREPAVPSPALEPMPSAPGVEPPAAPAPALPEGSGSDVRLPDRGGSSMMDRVFGVGKDPFGTSFKDLEGGLDYKADGPLRDGERAALAAKRMLQDELANDAVDAGLADDYFRELKNRLDNAWRPARKELNDGGEAVSQKGFMQDIGTNPQAFGEIWEVYLDLAKQYAKGEKLSIEKKRAERLREVLRSRKGNFRFHAICEVVVTHAPDGKVLTIEVPLSSSHPLFDEGVRDALVQATLAMPAPPPERLANGRPFRSSWRLRATWIMVPPTALLSGGAWDLTPEGVKIDVPFEIKLKKAITLQSFDNRDHSIRGRGR
jgi:hypothetical protein